MSKWYAIIVGIILVIVGLDPWLHTAPQMMILQPAGVTAIIVGLIGVIVGVMDRYRKKTVTS